MGGPYVEEALSSELDWLLRPLTLLSRSEAMRRPSPLPASAGIYGWYFDAIPPGIDDIRCHRFQGKTLLYVGIAPKGPPAVGKKPRTLRARIREHLALNAEGSTLRLTLGCLLADQLGIQLRRVGNGSRLTFTNPGERVLDTWLDRHAYVTYSVQPEPWILEAELLGSELHLPLNISGRRPGPPHFLAEVRTRARAAAAELPVVADSGGPRRLVRGIAG